METNNKNILANYILLFLITLFTSSCAYKTINYETGQDLIIDNVSVLVNLEHSNDQYGMPKRSGYKSLNITVRIKNIGAKPFNSPLYIASTNTEQDYQLHLFNSFILVEPSPTIILPDESIEIIIKKRVADDSSNMKFQVNYHTDPEKIAKEYDYFNNTYLVRF